MDNLNYSLIEKEADSQKPSIIDKVFGSYDDKFGTEKLLHHLQEALTSGALICLVCIENILIEESIWNCESCYCSFHLHCIEKWGRDSIFIQSQNLREDSTLSVGQNASRNLTWSCPKCRSDYPIKKIPTEYHCFCRKKISPHFDPWLIPHSCGEKCNKELKPKCGHFCLVLCHPGPCPPCPVMVRTSCYCGNATAQMRRCSSKGWSCNSICSQLLSCNFHNCQRKCHSGPCPTCQSTSESKCLCGSFSQTRPCANLLWQCEKICRKELPCGHHTCNRVCHKGGCGDCPDSGLRYCPCGKKSFNLPCTENVQTCGDTCSKPLSCGTHLCMERCHRGPCPSCLQVRVKKCICGLREKELPCSKTFSCETKCKKIKNCKKHTCNRKCCKGDCPPCEMPCGKTLSCGHHKCQSRCHVTKCFPCSVVTKLSCPCGGTSIAVPCGMGKKAVVPKCNIICKKKSACHHTDRKPHLCHEGRCPPCNSVCGRKLNCSHTCPVTCHEAVPVKIVDQKKRSGPWEGRASTYIEIQKQPCPPCKVKVPITCDGGHETIDIACSEWKPYSCRRKCGRNLECSHHRCSKDCHVVEGAKTDESQGLNCELCNKSCQQPRSGGCTHACKLPCHLGECPPCKEKMRMKCHCGILIIMKECPKWNGASEEEKEEWRSCTNQCNKEIICGHRCRKQCHSGSCSSPEECRERIILRCPCSRVRKSFPCKVFLSSRPTVPCDEFCNLKSSKQHEKQEEETAVQKEKEVSLNVDKGRKKRRKDKNTKEGQPQRDWTIIISLASLAALSLSVLLHFLIQAIW